MVKSGCGSEPIVRSSISKFMFISASCWLVHRVIPHLPEFSKSVLWRYLVAQRQVKCACTTMTLPLSNNTKTVPQFKCLNSDTAFTNFTVQKCDRQTKKQPKKMNAKIFHSPPVACEVQAISHWWLQQKKSVSFLHLPNFLNPAYSFAIRGTENFWRKCTPSK